MGIALRSGDLRRGKLPWFANIQQTSARLCRIESPASKIAGGNFQVKHEEVPPGLGYIIMPSALDFARSQQARFLEELKSLLRIPSISTLPEHAGDVRFAAESLAREMERVGLEHVRVIETSGHPLVYGDWLHAAGKPTCLAYGHYDVQPPDPLDEWHTPPFQPTERDGNLYARGAVDDKGQMYMHLKALRGAAAGTRRQPADQHSGDSRGGGGGWR